MRARARPLPADEIAVGGGGAAFARRHLVRVHRQAHRTARLAPLEAGIGEDAIEAFRLGLLRRLHDSPEEFLRAATDDASLVERDGGRVEIVAGEKTNIKLTSPEDLVFAEAILAEREGVARGVGP